MKLWLDDLRPAPKDFAHARSVNEAIAFVKEWESEGSLIELLDLDYDLGIYEKDGGNGQDFLEWLLYRESFYPVLVHSTDSTATANMEGLIAYFWE